MSQAYSKRWILKIILLILFTFESYKCSQISNQNLVNNVLTSYFIKFFTPSTKFPIELIDYSNDSKTKWYKYGSQNYISKLKQLPAGFLSFQSNSHGGNSLIINNFTKHSKFLLDHYETQPSDIENIIGNNKNTTYKNTQKAEYQSFLYTVAFLQSFELIEKIIDKDFSEFTCKANLIMPIGIDDNHTVFLRELIDKSIEIGLKFDSGNREHLKKNISKRSLESFNRGFRTVKKGDIISSLYSVIIEEGPIKVYTNQDPMPVECHLRLKNSDQSNDYLETVSRSMINHSYVNLSYSRYRIASFQWCFVLVFCFIQKFQNVLEFF